MYFAVICLSLFSSSIISFFNVGAVQLIAALVSEITVEKDERKILLIAAGCILCHIILYMIRYGNLVSRIKIVHYFRNVYTLNVIQRIFMGKPDEVLRINKSNFAYYANDLCCEYIDSVFLYGQQICGCAVTLISYVLCFHDVVPLELVILLMAVYSFMVMVTRKLKERMSAVSSSFVAENTKLNTALNEIIDNVENIRLAGISSTVEKRMQLLTEKNKKNMRDITKLNTISKVVTGVPNLVIQIVLFSYVQWNINNEGSIELYFIMQSIAVGIIACFETMFEVRMSYEKQKRQCEELNRVLSIEMVNQQEKAKAIKDLSKIELENVRYAYDFCINYPDMFYEKANITLIKGASGSGKTTLLRMISGLLTPDSGKIVYKTDDLTITDIRTNHINVAYLPQSCYIFHATVRYNITLGEVYSDEQIIQALKCANVYEFVMSLPNKLDSQIRMDNISGGERQRIALARAFIRKPELLILDESFAHLDAGNCEVIMNKLKSAETICIVTSHQSWFMQDDSFRIISLDEVSI